ncbi:MAG: hypothetical protein Q7K57_38510, partial [Burkholderiaceae bacterium]|nr:hypothetical protein [Burkholderiaceae bacterium]
DESCLLIINDADLCDERLFKSGLTILGQLQNAAISSRQFVNGCCSAVRKQLLNIILPIPEDVTNNHDGWIHDFGDFVRSRKVTPHVLQLYRRHRDNSSLSIAASLHKISRFDIYEKYKNIDPREGYIKNMAALNLISFRVEEKFSDIVDLNLDYLKIEEKLKRLIKEREAISRRIYLLERSRLSRLGFATANYINGDYVFFKGWKSLVKDIFR